MREIVRAAAIVMLCLLPATAAARISTDFIRSVIRAHLPEIRECYDAGLRSRPGLAGRITVRFTVEADGSVSAADIDHSDLAAPDVESCLLARVRELRFPAIGGGGTIRIMYPFVFTPPAPPVNEPPSP